MMAVQGKTLERQLREYISKLNELNKFEKRRPTHKRKPNPNGD